MPSFELTGPERVYPYARDVNGKPLGAVQPGDIRMFDEAPDSWWVPVVPPGGEAEETAAEAEPEPAPEPVPDGPQPAPPAVIPGA